LVDFDACPRIDIAALKGVPCYGALDLASTQDLLSFDLWFPSLNAVLSWSWLPEETARERDERDKVPYLTWARDENCRLKLTPGNVADYDQVEADILALREHFNIVACAYDRWNAQQIVTNLGNEGLSMVAFGQGFASMSAPTKEWIRVVAGHAASHSHSDLLRWAASNTMLQSDAAGNVKPSKKASKEKIDPIVAWIMAMGLSVLKPQPSSAYEKRGLRRL
jgi:phage terminase large subunit-like protein